MPLSLRAVLLIVAGLLAWPDEMPILRGEGAGEATVQAADATVPTWVAPRQPSLKARSLQRARVCRASQAIDDPDDDDDASEHGLTAPWLAAPAPRHSASEAAPLRPGIGRAGCDLATLCRLRC